MAVTLVQSRIGGNGTQTVTAAAFLTTTAVGFASPTTAGNLLVGIGWATDLATSGQVHGPDFTAAATGLTVSGATWTGAVTNGAGFLDDATATKGGIIGIWYILNAASMATTVASTLVAHNQSEHAVVKAEFSLYEFSGISSFSQFNVNQNTNGTQTTPFVSYLIGPSTATSNVFLPFAAFVAFPGSNLTAGPLFTLGPTGVVATIGQSEYNPTSGRTVSSGFTGTEGLWGLASAAFSASAAAATIVTRSQAFILGM